MKLPIPRSEFGRNVFILSIGTSIAQAIPVIISPVLTRIYSPEEFGLFTLYIAIVGLLGAISSFRYDLAIVLPKEEEKSSTLTILAITLSLIISASFFVIILLTGQEINNLLSEKSIDNYIYLAPLSIFLLSTYTALTFWLNRQKHYLAISKNRILQSGISNGIALIFGTLKFNANGLVIGHFLGYVLTTSLAAAIFFKQFTKNSITKNRLKEAIFEYIHHPKELFPAHAIGIIAMQLPIFFIGSHYGLAVAGLYALASRIVAIPTLLIANAICDVYRQQASNIYSNKDKFDQLFLATIKKAIKIAILPFAFIFLVSPYAFPLIFGSEWAIAGEYARILAVQTLINFIQNTVDAGALIVKASTYILLWHLMRLISYLSLILFVITTQASFIDYIIYQAIINFIFYSIDILSQYKFSKQPILTNHA